MLALTRHFIPPLSSDFSFSVLCLVGILVSNSNSHKLRVESQKWLCNPVLCAWPQQFQGHTVSSLCLGRGQGILYHNTPTKSNPQYPDLLHPLLCSLFLSPSVSYLGHWCASPAFSAPESSSSHTYVFISLGEQFTSDLDAPILHPHTQHLTTWSSRRFTHAHTHTHTHTHTNQCTVDSDLLDSQQKTLQFATLALVSPLHSLTCSHAHSLLLWGGIHSSKSRAWNKGLGAGSLFGRWSREAGVERASHGWTKSQKRHII